MFLYLCAHGSSTRVTADRFAIGPATVAGIVKEVAAVVCSLMGELVAFPPFRLCASHIASECGIPQIVGCIDGSHIPIARPEINGSMYYNRKCWYSVVLQAVVDWRGRFCDLDCKWPGRVRDGRVFRNSALAHSFPAISAASETITLPTGVDTYARIPYFLLGDSGYQNTNYLVTTFEIAETEADEIIAKMNKKLSHARYRVECAFGKLKCRWRILLKGIDQDVLDAPDIVFSLCIIQNFLKDNNDSYLIEEDDWRQIVRKYEARFPQPVEVSGEHLAKVHEMS